MSATTLSPDFFAASTTARPTLAHTLALWFARARERARDLDAVALMSDRDLTDFGSNRYEVMTELAKPFWRR